MDLPWVPSARGLSLVAALLVSAIGVGFAVAASADRSGDPLVGLVWIVEPVAQLGAAIGIEVGVIVELWNVRRRTVPTYRSETMLRFRSRRAECAQRTSC